MVSALDKEHVLALVTLILTLMRPFLLRIQMKFSNLLFIFIGFAVFVANLFTGLCNTSEIAIQYLSVRLTVIMALLMISYQIFFPDAGNFCFLVFLAISAISITISISISCSVICLLFWLILLYQTFFDF